MTDYALIKKDLKLIMGIDDEEMEQYESFVVSAAGCISSMLSCADYENDARIVRLCAARAYMQILLVHPSDEIISFKAGDVSFTRDVPRREHAKQLYAMALEDCRNLVKSEGFAFKAV